MSDPTEHLSETPHQRIDLRAADFIERRDCDSWTASDEAEFEIWLNAASAHRVAFIRLQASWRRTARLAALRPGDDRRKPFAAPAGWGRYVKGIAGLSAMLLLAGIAATYWLTPRYDTYATVVGGHKSLTLRDGSRIELNTNTVIRILRNSDRRFVQLERGEAFFQIQHDAENPFEVVTAGHRLIDLGTQFSVRTEQNQLRVALVEGKVRVESEGSPNGATRTLLPGDVLIAARGKTLVEKQPVKALVNAMAWRRGMLLFHETTLIDAAREFNRYNEVKIVINAPQAAHETINGALPAKDLEEFTRMARNIFGLKAERHGNTLVFTR
ncbi:MAG TPA: FecR domain-containing protein [Rhizomicrobium sp.]|nr:FecR domain-containing protein [Rhizomicrobium sp.]